VAGGVHVRIDTIEQALRAGGLDVYDEGYRVAYAVAEDNLRLGRIVVADSVNPWPLTRRAWRAVANRAHARALDVEIVCSNAVEHRRRVESRAADIDGHRLPTWDEVVGRDYRAWDTDRLMIDTAASDVRESAHAILARCGQAYDPAR
jgi:predicted kinase